MTEVVTPAIPARRREIVSSQDAHRRISAEQKVRTRNGVEDHPRLVFSDRVRAVQLGGERIVWVHLHRESLLDIEQLDERALIGDLAEPCFADWLSR